MEWRKEGRACQIKRYDDQHHIANGERRKKREKRETKGKERKIKLIPFPFADKFVPPSPHRSLLS
jgi:hypothetical protein